MPSQDGLTASLVCNGIVATEYPSSPDTPLTVYCESKPDDTFVVEMSGKQPPHDLSARLYVDGISVKSVRCSREGSRSTNIVFRGIYSSDDSSKLRPFRFTNVKLSDEDVGVQDENVIKNLGTVALKLYKCVYGERKTRQTVQQDIPKLAADQEFSEQNKKASMIPHAVGLGELVSTIYKEPLHSYPRISKEKDPYLEFTWHYRSRNVLIAKEIIPRPIVAPLTLSNSNISLVGNERDDPFVIDSDKEERKPSLSSTKLKRGVKASEPSLNQSSSSQQAVRDQLSDEKPDKKSGVRASKRLKKSEV